jgi:GNAT superfamily N-acetyltransferase
VLAGYRAIGDFDPDRWMIVRKQDADVGLLLLADEPAGNAWELVYMGVVPAARGQGLGVAMIRRAQWLAGQARRSRLTAAVDAANWPAVAAYAAAGFTAWDRRRLYVLANSQQRGSLSRPV